MLLRRFRPRPSRAAPAPALLAVLLVLAGAGAQAQHAGQAAAHAAHAPSAHAHGRLQLEVAIDDGLLTLRLDSPLDNLLGFEHAPRTDDERRRAQQARDRLSDPAALFAIDPAAGCRPAGGDWTAPALGEPPGPPPQAPAQDRPASPQAARTAGTHGSGPDRGRPDRGDDRVRAPDREHADLQARYAFRCADAARARFIDLPVFDAFPRLRTVSAQVAAPQGQFQRDVARPARRLAWGR